MTLPLGRVDMNWYCNWFIQYLKLWNIKILIVVTITALFCYTRLSRLPGVVSCPIIVCNACYYLFNYKYSTLLGDVVWRDVKDVVGGRERRCRSPRQRRWCTQGSVSSDWCKPVDVSHSQWRSLDHWHCRQLVVIWYVQIYDYSCRSLAENISKIQLLKFEYLTSAVIVNMHIPFLIAVFQAIWVILCCHWFLFHLFSTCVCSIPLTLPRTSMPYCLVHLTFQSDQADYFHSQTLLAFLVSFNENSPVCLIYSYHVHFALPWQ